MRNDRRLKKLERVSRGFHVVLIDTLPPETISSEGFEAAINSTCQDQSGSVIILDADADDL